MSLLDDMTKHRIFVQRLAGTECNSIAEQLKVLQKVAKQQISKSTAGLGATLRNTVKNMSKIGIENMTDIAVYESKFSAKVFSKYFDIDIIPVDEKSLQSALKKTNMALNVVKNKTGGVISVNENAKRKSVEVAYKQFGQKKAAELTQIIKDAQLNKLTASETAKLIDERVAGLFTTQARTLAATAVNYSTNIAKLETISENSETIKQETWVTQLEEGTCGYCEDNNGEVYDQGEAPECPAHFNCNCEVIPYV